MRCYNPDVGLLRHIAALVVLLVAWAPVQAQVPARGASMGNVLITLEQRGVGNAIRPGSWAGLQVRLEYAGDQPQPAVVVWRVPDADGDVVLWRRNVTLNPGAVRATRVWLYSDMSLRTDPGSLSYIEVYRALEPAAGSTQPRLGETLGILPITPGGVLSPGDSFIAVVGGRSFGLENYALRLDTRDDALPTGHALTRLVTGLRPESLPDRWMGLDQFGVIIWGPSQDLSPARLTDDQAAAIREWVLRGGHFVVVLPRVADIWIARTGENPLDRLLPSPEEVSVTLVEDAPLSLVQHLLTDDRDIERLSGTMNLFTFSGPGLATRRPGRFVRPAETVPLLADRLGRAVAIQRSHGTGVVTLIGLDLANPEPLLVANLPNADVFWNRVLGRRYHAPSSAEREAMAEGRDGVIWRSGRENVYLDEAVPGYIALSGSAAAGLLLAVLVFAAYWLLAGPGAWAALRYRKMHQHAWLAFLLAAGLFTAVSWVGATLLRPRDIATRHFTVVSAVSGQSLQSATTFFGVLLPDYGSKGIRLGAEESPWHMALSSFEHPRQPGQPFPDPRVYEMESDSPAVAVVPTRATAKQMKGRWLGQIEPPWSLPYAPDNIRVTDPADPMRTAILEGSLRHSFPRSPDRLVVVYVAGEAPFQTDRDRRRAETERARLLAEGLAWTVVSPWHAGDALDLADLTRLATIADAQLDEYLDSAAARRDGVATALYHHAVPPNYGAQRLLGREDPVLRKRLLYSADMSHWLTRPCLIVFATFSDVPSPVPISIDDQPAATIGEVQFRWVYPLPHTPRTGPIGSP